jgi:GMP synthase (glutamine-hydrolysing)
MQELAYRLNPDNVIAGTHREYGHAMLKARSIDNHVDRLFEGIEESMRVWMSHGDKLAKLPEGFHTVATSDNSEYAAIGHASKPIYGLQFHPEVTHTQNGTALLKNFAVGICGCKQEWTMQKFLEEAVAQIRHTVGEKGQVLAAVSGGVDSTVAAKLMVRSARRCPKMDPEELKLTASRKRQLAPGSGPCWSIVRHSLHVSNLTLSRANGIESDGVMRLNECEQVQKDLSEALGINLTVVDASQRFLDGLKGIDDPEVCASLGPPSISTTASLTPLTEKAQVHWYVP